MKLLPGKFTLGDISVSVYERERERGELLKCFGKAGHMFYETFKGTLE